MAGRTKPSAQTDRGRGTFYAESYDSIGTIATEWDRLADEVGAPPFMRSGWVSCWWESFGSGRLRIIALRDENAQGQLVGLVPVHETFTRLSSLSNGQSAESGMIAANGAAAAALAAHLFDKRPSQVSMAFVRDASAEYHHYRAAAAAAGYRVWEQQMMSSPYVETTGSWESYTKEKLSRNRRSQLGRARRRLEGEGRLEVESWTSQPDLDKWLDEAFAIEASGWKGEQGTAIVSRAHTRQFYRDMAHWAAQEGLLRIDFLRLESRGIAMMFFLQTKDTLYYLKGGFDPALHAFSPGMVLLESVLKRAFEGQTKQVDLLGDDDPYKVVFAQHAQRKMQFQAFSPSPFGLATMGAKKYGHPLARRALAEVPLARRILAETRQLREKASRPK